jgi:hypothetical protein
MKTKPPEHNKWQYIGQSSISEQQAKDNHTSIIAATLYTKGKRSSTQILVNFTSTIKPCAINGFSYNAINANANSNGKADI